MKLDHAALAAAASALAKGGAWGEAVQVLQVKQGREVLMGKVAAETHVRCRWVGGYCILEGRGKCRGITGLASRESAKAGSVRHAVVRNT